MRRHTILAALVLLLAGTAATSWALDETAEGKIAAAEGQSTRALLGAASGQAAAAKRKADKKKKKQAAAKRKATKRPAAKKKKPARKPAAKPKPPSSNAAKSGVHVLNIPGRYQYDQNNGYCGEMSIQTLMLRHGVWIPQEVARSAGGGELLPGINYDRALKNLKISYERFSGRGSSAFFAFAKRALKAGKGVVEVGFYRGGRDSDYDHIMPIVGVKANPVGSDAYSANDVFYVHSGYSTKAVQRRAGDYSCTAGNKKDSIMQAGCVPSHTAWGYALNGPVYAGIGPRVRLAVGPAREPGLGRSTTFRGTVTISGLTVGKKYELHRLTSLGAVPSSKAGRIGGAPDHAFTATAKTEKIDVSFASGKPAFFICTAA